MEFANYYVVKADDKENLKQKMTQSKAEGVIFTVDFLGQGDFDTYEKGKRWIAVSTGHSMEKLVDVCFLFSWRLDSYWKMIIYEKGKEIGQATFGQDVEHGISKKENGFIGNEEKCIQLLGISSNEFEICLHAEGFDQLHELLHFPLIELVNENENPPGLHFAEDLA